MGHGDDLDHIRTMIDTFLHHGLERLQRISTLDIVVRTDEYRTVFMSGCTHTLRHLLLRLYLHIHISRPCLDGTHQPLLGDLHGLDLTALLRHLRICQLLLSHLRDAACRHQRNIAGK